ncbi:unnamed protein product [Echinostoma caproni]|uniref:DDE-1 domain-containing protein n=1 Tax=Echinostoma caproni TaxID=27848 RepID=A0A183AEL1_9TREM|nr:unnamed protein product [Echinostoma caproni]
MDDFYVISQLAVRRSPQNIYWNVLSLIEDEQRITKAEADVPMAMHLVKKAWVSVHPNVTINALMKAGFKSTLIHPVM